MVDCRGVGRERVVGLILLWKEKISFNIMSWSLNHITGTMMDDEDGQPWKFCVCMAIWRNIIRRIRGNLFSPYSRIMVIK